MNLLHGVGEHGHELEPLPHLVGAGQHDEAVVDVLLLRAVTAGQQLLTPGAYTAAVKELSLTDWSVPRTVCRYLRLQ